MTYLTDGTDSLTDGTDKLYDGTDAAQLTANASVSFALDSIDLYIPGSLYANANVSVDVADVTLNAEIAFTVSANVVTSLYDRAELSIGPIDYITAQAEVEFNLPTAWLINSIRLLAEADVVFITNDSWLDLRLQISAEANVSITIDSIDVDVIRSVIANANVVFNLIDIELIPRPLGNVIDPGYNFITPVRGYYELTIDN